jgi:Ca2+-binding EF-hand superfamily protein
MLMEAFKILNKVAPNGSVTITRPEVETLLTVQCEIVPSQKTIQKMQGLFWHYDEEDMSFSKFF